MQLCLAAPALSPAAAVRALVPEGDALWLDAERAGGVCPQFEEANPGGEMTGWPGFAGGEAPYPPGGGQWKVLLVRHAESTGNIISQRKGLQLADWKKETWELAERGVGKYTVADVNFRSGMDIGGSKKLIPNIGGGSKKTMFCEHIKSTDVPKNEHLENGKPAQQGTKGMLGKKGDHFECLRDSLLSVTGEGAALRTAKVLFGKDFDQDKTGVFAQYKTLLTSPLRRCLTTSALVFGLAHDSLQPHLMVQNFPCAHRVDAPHCESISGARSKLGRPRRLLAPPSPCRP